MALLPQGPSQDTLPPLLPQRLPSLRVPGACARLCCGVALLHLSLVPQAAWLQVDQPLRPRLLPLVLMRPLVRRHMLLLSLQVVVGEEVLLVHQLRVGLPSKALDRVKQLRVAGLRLVAPGSMGLHVVSHPCRDAGLHGAPGQGLLYLHLILPGAPGQRLLHLHLILGLVLHLTLHPLLHLLLLCLPRAHPGLVCALVPLLLGLLAPVLEATGHGLQRFPGQGVVQLLLLPGPRLLVLCLHVVRSAILCLHVVSDAHGRAHLRQRKKPLGPALAAA